MVKIRRPHTTTKTTGNANIGIRYKDGDKYPIVYDTETGNELKGIISISITADGYNRDPQIHIVADVSVIEIEGDAQIEAQD